jgi:predicted DsbA family dithiol-disulfide isomerase
MEMMTEKITVDVVSDVACPWCYVGKRRLEAAIEQWQGAEIVVNWHPYQLDPTMPEEGFTRDEYLVNKFGSIEKMQSMTDHLTAVGKEVGIDFDFGENWMSVNTLHLHQLLHVAGQEGFKDQLKERFLMAYFVELDRLNNKEVLYSILSDFGWESNKVDAVINDKEIATKVQQQIAHSQKIGVTGVPYFIINNKYAISGAQPSSVFLEAFNKLSSIESIIEGDSCDTSTGDC